MVEEHDGGRAVVEGVVGEVDLGEELELYHAVGYGLQVVAAA